MVPVIVPAGNPTLLSPVVYMTVPPRFCIECGAPLSLQARFCEECGAAADGTPPPAPQVPAPDLTAPVVIPFASAPGGIFSRTPLVLFITPDTLVTVSLPRDIAGEINAIRESLEELLEKEEISARDFQEVSATLVPGLPRAYFGPRQIPAGLKERASSIRARSGLDQAPWTRFSNITPDQIISGYPGSRCIPLSDILYVRGEDLAEGTNGEDLLVVRTRDREEHYRLALGGFYTARVALTSRIMKCRNVTSPGEKVINTVPLCFEPGPEDFEFQYTFNLIFTTGRLLLAVSPGSEDEVERRWNTFMKLLKDESRTMGVSEEEYAAGTDFPDAPWQVFRTMPTEEVLDTDGVNYCIPYSSLQEVVCSPGRKPAISLVFPQSRITLQADSMFAVRSLRDIQRALHGTLKISL